MRQLILKNHGQNTGDFYMKKKNTILVLGLAFAVTIHFTAFFSNGTMSEPIRTWSSVGIILAILIAISLYYHYENKRRHSADCGPFRNDSGYESNKKDIFWSLFTNIFASKRNTNYERPYENYTNNTETSTPTFYELLGISKNSTEEEIKTAFRKQIIKFHSDKNNIDDADEFVKILYDARDTLISSEKRREYDSHII